jgi:hypothetical protein
MVNRGERVAGDELSIDHKSVAEAVYLLRDAWGFVKEDEKKNS